jgi:glutamyl-tRNA reductase
MDLILYGTSYKTAPLEVRERFSLSQSEAFEMLSQLKELKGILEATVLSTCNRTELFVVCEDGYDPISVKEFFHKSKGVGAPVDKDYFYSLKNIDVVRHLFRVSSGLESQMVGENQIKGQLKEAYRIACGLKTSGTILNKLFHMAFKVGKSVRTETNLGSGAVSISSAAVELSSHIFESLEGKSALLIGAGETGDLVAKHLFERGISKLKIANRTRERADSLSKSLGAEVVSFDSIADEFFNNDIVISATASQDYVVTAKMLEGVAAQNKSKRVMAIDIAIPRDIEPEVSKLGNIFLYDMDDLKVVVDKNLQERNSEIPYAEKIIDRAVVNYQKWYKERRVVPTIKVLQKSFEEVRVAELERNKHCGTCSKRSEVDQITKRIINKILRAPITKLVEDTDCSEAELKYLRNLFARENNEK